MNNATIVCLCLGGGFLLLFLHNYFSQYKKGRPDLDQTLSKYSPDMGSYAADWQKRKADARTDLLVSLNAEASQANDYQNRVIDLETKKTDLEHLPRKLQIEHIQHEEQHQTYLRSQENQRAVLNEATNQRLTPSTYEEIVKLRSLMAYEVEKKRLLDELDVKKLREENTVHLQLGFVASLQEHEELKLLKAQLDQLYLEVEEVLRGSLPEIVKTRRIQLLEQTIQRLENGYEARLLSVSGQKEISGIHENPESGGNPSETIRPTEE